MSYRNTERIAIPQSVEGLSDCITAITSQPALDERTTDPRRGGTLAGRREYHRARLARDGVLAELKGTLAESPATR